MPWSIVPKSRRGAQYVRSSRVAEIQNRLVTHPAVFRQLLATPSGVGATMHNGDRAVGRRLTRPHCRRVVRQEAVAGVGPPDALRAATPPGMVVSL